VTGDAWRDRRVDLVFPTRLIRAPSVAFNAR
jgi:hypothetical protein